MPYKDDMGLDIQLLDNGKAIHRFVVSERALALFRECGFNQGEILETFEV